MANCNSRSDTAITYHMKQAVTNIRSLASKLGKNFSSPLIVPRETHKETEYMPSHVFRDASHRSMEGVICHCGIILLIIVDRSRTGANNHSAFGNGRAHCLQFVSQNQCCHYKSARPPRARPTGMDDRRVRRSTQFQADGKAT